MQYSASDFRTMAREKLSGKWGTAILLTLLATILGAATTAALGIELKFESGNGVILVILEEYSFTILKGGIISTILAVMVLGWGILTLVIGGAMTLGYCQFHQNLVRNEEAEVNTLFVHKEKLWHGFCINFLQGLYIILWTLCFLIPGIMAGYSYSMAHFIANDHPEMTAGEVITASKEMMRGHRWRLFCLEISFIGWALLSAFTLGLGTFALAPYMEMARAFFYQDLLEHGIRLEDEFQNVVE